VDARRLTGKRATSLSQTGYHPTPTARSTAVGTSTETDYTVGAYIGGPLIEDTLFMFLSGEKLISNRGTAGSVNDGTWTKSDNTNDRYLAKFDWNITNDHHLELSLVGDRYYSTEKLSTYDYATGTHSSDYGAGPLHQHRWHQRRRGCGLQILKYTGYWTDDLTATALYGQSKTPHLNTFSGVDVSNASVRCL
jgi:hypothetical protein